MQLPCLLFSSSFHSRSGCGVTSPSAPCTQAGTSEAKSSVGDKIILPWALKCMVGGSAASVEEESSNRGAGQCWEESRIKLGI